MLFSTGLFRSMFVSICILLSIRVMLKSAFWNVVYVVARNLCVGAVTFAIYFFFSSPSSADVNE